MSIQTRPFNNQLKETYSDLGFKIQKVGFPNEVYDSAVDWDDSTYQYVETNLPIEPRALPEEQEILV